MRKAVTGKANIGEVCLASQVAFSMFWCVGEKKGVVEQSVSRAR